MIRLINLRRARRRKPRVRGQHNPFFTFTYIMMGLFLTGICIGTSISNIVNTEKCTNVIMPVLNSAPNAELYRLQTFLSSMITLIKPIMFIWAFGLTKFASAGIITALVYKGGIIGFYIGSAIRVLGFKCGFLISAASILPQNIIYLPTLFTACIFSYRNSIYGGSRALKCNLAYIRQLVLSLILCVTAAATDTYITSFILDLAKNSCR